MRIPEGTVLSRAKREGWTGQIADAKGKAHKPEPEQSSAITVMQSAALSIAERGKRHVERMAQMSENVGPHVLSLQPGEVLDRIEDVDRSDKLSRRTYGLDEGGKIPALIWSSSGSFLLPP